VTLMTFRKYSNKHQTPVERLSNRSRIVVINLVTTTTLVRYDCDSTDVRDYNTLSKTWNCKQGRIPYRSPGPYVLLLYFLCEWSLNEWPESRIAKTK